MVGDEHAVLLRGEHAILDELVRLFGHRGEVRGVHVSDVGTEERLHRHAEAIDLRVERPRVHLVVGFAAEVEVLE